MQSHRATVALRDCAAHFPVELTDFQGAMRENGLPEPPLGGVKPAHYCADVYYEIGLVLDSILGLSGPYRNSATLRYLA